MEGFIKLLQTEILAMVFSYALLFIAGLLAGYLAGYKDGRALLPKVGFFERNGIKNNPPPPTFPNERKGPYY